MRRQFRLPNADEAYLDARSLTWETVVDGKQHWLLVHGWPTSDGYDHRLVSVAIRIPSTYPEAALDMMNCSPSLSRTDGRAIPNVSPVTILGQPWQQWSRHYSPTNPWRCGEDDLSTHLILVDHWLRREFNQ